MTIFTIFRVGFPPKIFWLIFLGSLERGLKEVLKLEKLNGSIWRIQLSKLRVPPPETPPCRARILYSRWGRKVRKRNRVKNSSTLGVIGIVVNVANK